MNFNNFSIRAVAAIGALCGAIAAPAISHAAGAVSVNGTTHCASSAQMSLTPSGDIAITCGAIVAPVCTVSGTSTIGIGQSVIVQASCNPAANTYAWTTNGGPAISGSGGTLTFPTAGTFTYQVTGTNSAGAGAISVAATVTVSSTPQVPSCTITATPSTVVAGQSSTLSASCSPSATQLLWSGNPSVSGASQVVSFPTAGTYTYTVIGVNSAGAGVASAPVTVTVNAPNPGQCTATGTGSFAGNGIRNLAIDRGGWVSYAMPVYTAAGRTIEVLSIQSTSSQQDLTSEFSISECPGNFDTAAPDCRTWGTVNQSGTQLYATTSGSNVNGTCTLILGKQYYINVRNTRYDRVTPACTPQTCYMILQLNSY